MLIAQLAVDRRSQGKRLGEFTLIRALQHAYRINLHLPSYAVVVDAFDDKMVGFYEQYGFQLLPAEDQQLRLFLPMKTVAQLV